MTTWSSRSRSKSSTPACAPSSVDGSLRTTGLVIGDVALDEGDRRVWVADQEVALSRREFDMLNSLMSSRGRVVSRARLYDDVWDYEVDIASNALDVHMSRLRRALAGSASVTIRTLRGVGYRLELDRR